MDVHERTAECGTELSELLPHTSEIVGRPVPDPQHAHRGATATSLDPLLPRRHPPASCGRPTLGSWLVYGLGSESQNLPAYMVLSDPGGLPVDGVTNWANGFMPAMFQGTVLRPQRAADPEPPAPRASRVRFSGRTSTSSSPSTPATSAHPGEAELEARIASYELAARMQTAATEALDLSQETEATQKLYGLDQDATREYGTRCLIARRLVERGCSSCSCSTRPAVGQPQRPQDRPPVDLPQDGPARGGARQGPQAAGAPRKHDRSLGGEIGRLPVTQNQGARRRRGGTTTARASASGWREAGSRGMAYGKTDGVRPPRPSRTW